MKEKGYIAKKNKQSKWTYQVSQWGDKHLTKSVNRENEEYYEKSYKEDSIINMELELNRY